MLDSLDDLYVTHGAQAVVDAHASLTRDQVYRKASEMGLKRHPRKPDAAKRVARNNEPVFGLTQGELTVLRIVAEGRGAKHVARVMGTTSMSVAGRLEAVFKKLGVVGQVGAVLKAERAGLLAGVEPFTKVES